MMIGALDAPRRQVAELDYALLWSVLLLLFTGLVFVYSASIAIAEGGRSTGHQPAYYLVRQGIFLCIGLVAAACAFQVPLSTWQQLSPRLFVADLLKNTAVGAVIASAASTPSPRRRPRLRRQLT